MEKDQKFVEDVVKALVNHPEDVRTERKVDERGVLITLHVNPADMGYVIGRQGKTAEAIRRLTRTIGAMHDARVNLRIFEPEGSNNRRSGYREDRGDQGDRNDSDSKPSAPSNDDDVDTSAVEDLNI